MALGSLLAALVIAQLASTAGAASTVTVSTTADSGAGSLRSALAGAVDGDTIILPAGRYPVTSGDLETNASVTIRGAGARRTILASDGGSRVLRVELPASSVTLIGLTITGGFEESGDGGGVLASSDLSLIGVTVRGNAVKPNNSGGGITAADVTLLNSTVSGNTAYNGGAVEGDNIFAKSSTVAFNTAGGPNDNGNSGALRGSVVIATNSTIAHNRCFNGFFCAAAIDASDVALANSILVGNKAFESNGFPAGSAGNPGVLDECPVNLDQGHNLADVTPCAFTEPTSRDGINPKLGALKRNGGQTDTLSPLRGSPAIGQGGNCGETDQRGVPRPQAGRCDIGAVEVARCAGRITTVTGTAARDRIRGTKRADVIATFGGNDVVRGLRGGDRICGGRGRDRLFGGPGRDRLFGQPGRDLLIGGPGLDLLRGGPGRDRTTQ